MRGSTGEPVLPRIGLKPDVREGLLTEFSTLNPGTTQQLAVLLLRHALAPLLDD
jgi:hypothetical protein